MSASTAPQEVDLRSTVDVCAFVDELGASAIGELSVSGADGPRGTVFVEGGRVCWAAARGLGLRLSELLGARSSLPPAAMESVFRECKSQQIPLGEHLVQRGVLSADDLRGALLQHTIESLQRVCIDEGRGSWRPHRGSGYSPRFTFATAELLAQAGAATHAGAAEDVRPMLEKLFLGDQWGAAFVRGTGSAFPELVATHGSIPTSATVLLRAGKWAASILDIAEAFTHDPSLVWTNPGATSHIAFRHEGCVVTGETDAFGPARILNHRAQQRRSGGERDGILRHP